MSRRQPEARAEDGSTLGDVRGSDVLLDRLASRAPLTDSDDDLVRLLSGWVQVVDAEADAATAPRTRRGRRAPVTGVDAIATDARVVPVAPRRRSRGVPWQLLSAGAAAVIAVLAVGLGSQDATRLLPGTTVAESVQSIEATLVAARLAAEDGDVVGARLLLERARELVAGLPEAERGRFEVVLETTERGVSSAEEAVRDGEPFPAWPVGLDVATEGLPTPTAPPPGTPPTVPGAPGAATGPIPGVPGKPVGEVAPTTGSTLLPPGVGEPGAGPTTPGAPPVAVPPVTAPTTPPTTPPADPAPTTRQTTTPTVKPTTTPTTKPTAEPTPKPTTQPTTQPTVKPSSQPTGRPTAGPTNRPTAQPGPTTRPTQAPTRTQGGPPTTRPDDARGQGATTDDGQGQGGKSAGAVVAGVATTEVGPAADPRPHGPRGRATDGPGAP